MTVFTCGQTMPYMPFVETELSQIDGSENRLPGIPGSVKCPPGRLG
jgi:hypothetical protein